MIESILFFVFGAMILTGVGFMIFSKNVIHAAYALAVVLLGLAALFVLLNAEYLAVVQIFLYAGGVVVLLIFGIMVTNRVRRGTPMTSHRAVWVSTFLALGIVAMLGYVTSLETFEFSPATGPIDQTRILGMRFLTDHLIAFEFVAILLLAVLVGASFLAKKSSGSD